jgi:hypothetical protein
MKLNPFTCLQLYDLCLKRGFNSMDSYLMLKEDSGLLIHAYEIMESSRKYSEQQLEYISTILTVKTMYDNMISSGSLVAPYTDNDEKRLTIVTIEEESDNPLLGGHIIHLSENGFIQPESDISIPEEYKKTISMLKQGDQLIRFLNVPYSMKFGHDMFIPVLLKNNEISPGT